MGGRGQTNDAKYDGYCAERKNIKCEDNARADPPLIVIANDMWQ